MIDHSFKRGDLIIVKQDAVLLAPPISDPTNDGVIASIKKTSEPTLGLYISDVCGWAKNTIRVLVKNKVWETSTKNCCSYNDRTKSFLQNNTGVKNEASRKVS